MDFLDQDYEVPTAPSSYMKFEKGENKFRILGKPILGWLDWHEKNPIRYRMDEKPPEWKDATKPGKHFWALKVWNYGTQDIQILEITQASIQKAIKALAADSDWGAPYGYDIKVVREGDGMDTKYTVNPVPHKQIAAEILTVEQEKYVNLEALYDHKDPFKKEG